MPRLSLFDSNNTTDITHSSTDNSSKDESHPEPDNQMQGNESNVQGISGSQDIVINTPLDVTNTHPNEPNASLALNHQTEEEQPICSLHHDTIGNSPRHSVTSVLPSDTAPNQIKTLGFLASLAYRSTVGSVGTTPETLDRIDYPSAVITDGNCAAKSVSPHTLIHIDDDEETDSEESDPEDLVALNAKKCYNRGKEQRQESKPPSSYLSVDSSKKTVTPSLSSFVNSVHIASQIEKPSTSQDEQSTSKIHDGQAKQGSDISLISPKQKHHPHSSQPILDTVEQLQQDISEDQPQQQESIQSQLAQQELLEQQQQQRRLLQPPPPRPQDIIVRRQRLRPTQNRHQLSVQQQYAAEEFNGPGPRFQFGPPPPPHGYRYRMVIFNPPLFESRPNPHVLPPYGFFPRGMLQDIRNAEIREQANQTQREQVENQPDTEQENDNIEEPTPEERIHVQREQQEEQLQTPTTQNLASDQLDQEEDLHITASDDQTQTLQVTHSTLELATEDQDHTPSNSTHASNGSEDVSQNQQSPSRYFSPQPQPPPALSPPIPPGPPPQLAVATTAIRLGQRDLNHPPIRSSPGNVRRSSNTHGKLRRNFSDPQSSA